MNYTIYTYLTLVMGFLLGSYLQGMEPEALSVQNVQLEDITEKLSISNDSLQRWLLLDGLPTDVKWIIISLWLETYLSYNFHCFKKLFVGISNALACSFDWSAIVTRSDERKIVVWDTQTEKPLKEFTCGVSGPVLVSPDGTKKLTRSEEDCCIASLWSNETGEKLWDFEGLVDHIWALAFSPDGTKIFAGCESQAACWEVKTGNLLQEFTRDGSPLSFGAFSLSGAKLIIGSDNTACLYDISTGKFLQKCIVGTGQVVSGVFNPDETKILIGTSHGAVYLYASETGKKLQQFIGHTGSINSVVFSFDGVSILTGSRQNGDGTGVFKTESSDTTVRLWDVKTGKELHCFKGTSNVLLAAFNAEGDVVIGYADGTVQFWKCLGGPVECLYVRRESVKKLLLYGPQLSSLGQNCIDGVVDKNSEQSSVEETHNKGTAIEESLALSLTEGISLMNCLQKCSIQ